MFARTGGILTRLLPLYVSEHPDPGFRLRWLTGERCRTGILPRYDGSVGPVHRNHVASERLFGFLVSHHVVDDRVQRRVGSHTVGWNLPHLKAGGQAAPRRPSRPPNSEHRFRGASPSRLFR